MGLSNLSWENTRKYAYGLLRLKPEDLEEIDVRDFLDMVNGALSWDRDVNDAELDILFEQLSHFTANIMLSSGNYKKSTKLERIKESLYIPLRDREAYEKKHRQSKGKPKRSHKDAPADKVEELKRKFNL